MGRDGGCSEGKTTKLTPSHARHSAISEREPVSRIRLRRSGETQSTRAASAGGVKHCASRPHEARTTKKAYEDYTCVPDTCFVASDRTTFHPTHSRPKRAHEPTCPFNAKPPLVEPHPTQSLPPRPPHEPAYQPNTKPPPQRTQTSPRLPTRIGRTPGGPHPFTAPAVRPPMRYFWSLKKSAMTGRETRIAPAAK